jgi:ABC-2 type transport system permease protein
MNASQITWKDLLLLSRDRRTLFVLVALPLAFIAIIGSSTGQLFSEAQNARKYKLGVVDTDKSELATNLIDELHNLKALEVVSFPDSKSAKQALAENDIHVVLQIGPKYHELVDELEVYDILHPKEGRLQGSAKSLDVSVEAGSFLANASELLETVVFGFALQTVGTTVVKKNPKLAVQIQKASSQSRPQLEDQLKELPTAPASQAQPPNLNTIVYQTVVPGYTVMFVFFIVNFMARSFIGEHDMGTLSRLRLAPITRSGMMIGKTVPFLVISLIQTALLFLAGKVLFGMDWGRQPWLLLPVMLCTSMAATSLGLMVATLVRTEAQVSAYGNFLVLTMAGISGCMMPRSWQPELMQKLGLVTPHSWALIAYDQILNRPNPEMTVVVRCCLTMLAFSTAYFAVGWWRSREMEQP